MERGKDKGRSVFDVPPVNEKENAKDGLISVEAFRL